MTGIAGCASEVFAMKKIAIIGPGAMGSLFAAYLENAGLDVTLIDHDKERAARLTATGISVKGVRGNFKAKVPVITRASKLGPVDLVMVCVKAYQTTEAMEQNVGVVGPKTSVLSVQNGLGNLEALSKVISENNIIAGTTTLGANLLSPGMVHHAGDGDTIIGPISVGNSERIADVARVLESAGFRVLVSDRVMESIWNKLFINVGINALTAILHVRNGILLDNDASRTTMDLAVAEAVEAASSQGMNFDLEQTQAKVRQVAKATSNNRSSMLVDIQMGRKTEIDYINGAIAKAGDAPVNNTLTLLVHALEATFAHRHRQD